MRHTMTINANPMHPPATRLYLIRHAHTQIQPDQNAVALVDPVANQLLQDFQPVVG